MDKNYYIRRQKNNEAVKKSREKTRNQAEIMVDKLQSMKDSNSDLVKQIKHLSEEIAVLKKVFMQYAGNGKTLPLTAEQVEFLKKESEIGEVNIEELFANGTKQHG